MFPASTNGGGQAMAIPDVCKVPAPPSPPVPTPFPNIAMLNQANGSTCSSRVRILNRKACTVRTEISRTSGDEAGTAMGVVSNKQMDKAVFRQGSAKVKVEGAAIVTAMTPPAHTGPTATAPVGSPPAPSQPPVIISG